MNAFMSISVILGVSIWLVSESFGGTIEPVPVDPQGKVAGTETAKRQLTERFSSSVEAAANALATLKSPDYFKNDSDGQEHARSLGFQSIDEIREATFGKPIEVRNFGLKQLQDYGPKDNAINLLTNSHETIYPIYVHEAVRSSLTVSDMRTMGDWRWVGRGAPHFTQKTERLRVPYSNMETFLVQNQALGLRFIGVIINEQLKLVPLSSVEFPNVAFKEGQEVSGHEVFIALAPIAKELLSRTDLRGQLRHKAQ